MPHKPQLSRQSLGEYGPDDFLKVSDVVRLTRISKNIVYAAIRRGELPPFRPTERVVRVQAKYVRAWIERLTYDVTPLTDRRRRA